MYTARDVTLRLRRELSAPGLVVKFNHEVERWCVYQRVKRWGGARNVAGIGRLRQLYEVDECVLTHEEQYVDPETGGLRTRYLPLEPNLMRDRLVQQDRTRYRNAREHFKALMAPKERAKAEEEKRWRADLKDRTHYELVPRMRRFLDQHG